MRRPNTASSSAHPKEHRPWRLKGRVALVTGASSGLGRAIANELQDTGYRVYGTSRKVMGKDNPYGDFALIAMNVDQDVSVEAAIGALVDREGGLDVVVSNAGMALPALWRTPVPRRLWRSSRPTSSATAGSAAAPYPIFAPASAPTSSSSARRGPDRRSVPGHV
jgi:NAD(P)-dependent dehydrogenase (short-subunit alcohol dehydrogenase family)